MSERRSTDRRQTAPSRRRKEESDEVRAKAQETKKKTAEEGAPDALDNQAHPDQADPVRHWLYFGAFIVGSFVINLLVLVAISGGQ